MTEFHNQSYWESRLRSHFSLEGVGYLRLGRRFNEWMYRVRGDVFDRVVNELGIPERIRANGAAGFNVADIGPGTGFYVDRWIALGARVTGVDLTQVAVEKLRHRYPAQRFMQADIGAPLAAPLADELGKFQVVSAFDVLFHIVDDEQYRQSLSNVASLLEPGGWFLWSDNFIHRKTVRVRHQVSRSLPEIEAALRQAGFEIVRRVPMFVLMNYPADTSSRVRQLLWTAVMSPAMISDRLGGMLGALLYPLERRLVARRSESASTEIMVCRKS